jgi:drug/metabolite transporter (DMT)-like permease
MIQRIQTVWYLIATLLLGCTFIVDIYRQKDLVDLPNLGVGTLVIGIILVVISMVLSFYTIFLFKNRKRQITFSWLSIIAALVTFAYLYISCESYIEQHQIVNGYYWIGLFLPLASVVFLIMGMMGVKKDEKLIKSLDRLR